MVNIRYANAMAEVLQYLKGIRKEDVDKIPKKFIAFLQKNASKKYECKFDYEKPIKELELLDETRGIIGVICLNYWCETEEQKSRFLYKMNENERKYQEELIEKYHTDNLFKNKKEKIIKSDIKNESNENEVNIIPYKESVIKKIVRKIIKLIDE